MPVEYRDRVADTSTTTGTGTLTLTGTAPTGYRNFTAHTTGATVRYAISSADNTQWEVGEGVWTTSGATLTRATIFASSNAGAAVNFSAGTKDVKSVMTATDAATITQAVDKLFVTLTAAANSTTAGWQKVPMTNVVLDSNSIWVSGSTRAIPKKAGYYLVTVNLRFTTTGFALAAVGKNGSPTYEVGADTTGTNCGGATVVYCNGSTDYIEAYIYSTTARAFNTTGSNRLELIGPL